MSERVSGKQSGAVSPSALEKLLDSINAVSSKVDSVNEQINALENDILDDNPSSINNGTGSVSSPAKPYVNPITGKRFLHDSSETESLHSPPPKKLKKSKKDKKKKKSKKSRKSSSSSSSDSDSEVEPDPQMQELMQEYQSSKPKYLEDPTTDDLPEPLAKTLETWFWSVYSKEEVKAELAKPLRPANAPALIPTRINEAVFRSISAQGLSHDMPSRFIQNAFMKAAQPISIVWSKLIALENHLKATGLDLKVDFTSNLSIDFRQLRKDLDQALRLIGIANSQMVVHRKETLSAFLNKDFKKICRSHIPFDQWMFSSNLKGLLEDTIRVNRLVQQNQPSSTSSQGKKFFSPKRGQSQTQNQRG